MCVYACVCVFMRWAGAMALRRLPTDYWLLGTGARQGSRRTGEGMNMQKADCFS